MWLTPDQLLSHCVANGKILLFFSARISVSVGLISARQCLISVPQALHAELPPSCLFCHESIQFVPRLILERKGQGEDISVHFSAISQRSPYVSATLSSAEFHPDREF